MADFDPFPRYQALTTSGSFWVLMTDFFINSLFESIYEHIVLHPHFACLPKISSIIHNKFKENKNNLYKSKPNLTQI